MRNIYSGIAALITKENLFNRRVVFGGFIVLASALVSYMTMATYVPSLVHAYEPASSEKRENRTTLASHSSGVDSEDEADGQQGAQDGGQAETSERSSGSQESEGESSNEAAKINEEPSAEGSRQVSAEISAPPVPAPREVIADAPAEREVRRNDSKPSPVVASKFRADGCSKRGTSVLRHHNKQVRWDNYGEYTNGTQGNCVKSVQKKLNQYCTNKLNVDGHYGPRTASAVRAYQQYMRSLGGITVNGSKIHVDGIAGAQTFALMQEFAANKSFLKC